MTDTTHLAAALAPRYRLERELGAGGMATVYLAQDLKHDRPVALKVLRPDLAAVIGAQRFLAEIKVTANLQHPHIVTLIDSGETDGTLWYVLPYIRGESLRDRLVRERQLGVDETLTITRQIAGALDYAHGQGVIHRDIKPENILLHEGEAMLADFGIALAVKQAGGNRLTETGLSLGTPQYMSPEQATADRTLDARSDVYSLGAVVYEMLAGEPPHTGATAHAVIAKLLTERPVSLQVVRSTLPAGIDAAVSRSLEKVAADRFPSAGEFARALDAARGTTPVPAVPPRRRELVLGLPVVLLVVAAVGWLALRVSSRASPAPSFSLRTQVTFTGNNTQPALSADGTQIAYVIRECNGSVCKNSIEIQDAEGTSKRRLVEGVSAIGFLRWSPDRRFLLFYGNFGGKDGCFLVSTLGGAPQYIGPAAGSQMFLSNSDSLVVNETLGSADTSGWIKVETVDGETGDSVRVHGLPGGGYALPFRGDQWLLLGNCSQSACFDLRIVDRQGRQSDRIIANGATFAPMPGGNGVWFPVPIGGSRFAVVRIPVDLNTGRFRAKSDTVLDVATSVLNVSGDGRAIAYVEGSTQYDLWVMPLSDAFRGSFTPDHHVLGSTSNLTGGLSPDGTHVLVELSVPSVNQDRTRMSILPVAGGPGVNFSRTESTRSGFWSKDGTHVLAEEHSGAGAELVTFDPRTGAQERGFELGNTTVRGFDALPGGGWVWITAPYKVARLQRSAQEKPRDIPFPPGEVGADVNASSDGARLVMTSRIPGTDSLILNAVALPDGRVTRWATLQGVGVTATWLADGSLMAAVRERGLMWTMYHVRGPGQVERLGTIPRSLAVSWSRDGRRVAVITREVHGDIWLARSSAPRP